MFGAQKVRLWLAPQWKTQRTGRSRDLVLVEAMTDGWAISGQTGSDMDTIWSSQEFRTVYTYWDVEAKLAYPG